MPYNDTALVTNGYDSDWKYRSNVRFGFKSIAQLRSWIYRRSWLLALDKAGYVCSVYRCTNENAIFGDTQAVFKKNKSTLIKVLTLSDLPEE